MIKIEDGWLIDATNNKCSIAYFGSEEAAREAKNQEGKT